MAFSFGDASTLSRSGAPPPTARTAAFAAEPISVSLAGIFRPSVEAVERAAAKIAELLRGLRAMNGWPREVAQPQRRQIPLDTCPDDARQISARKWFPRSYRAESDRTQRRPGSAPAGKFFPALALPATLIPSVRVLQRTRRNESSADLRIGLPESNRVAYAEA
jgi:hypothetical protein